MKKFVVVAALALAAGMLMGADYSISANKTVTKTQAVLMPSSIDCTNENLTVNYCYVANGQLTDCKVVEIKASAFGAIDGPTKTCLAMKKAVKDAEGL